MSRLKLTDNRMDIIIKMSEGNPGAMEALMHILEKHEEIDPQAMMGGTGSILLLDTWEIYGAAIYVLFSDKCNKDVRKMLMLMRAAQLGLFSHTMLKEMAADQERNVNLSDEEWQDLDTKVCDILTEFKKAA